jgi:NAD(P)-dependent dehydrogenase (short-subunit alcohol dehydrogenase family)
MRLDSKVALVTGGATGIGAAVVRRFVEEGASVAITDVNEAAGAALAAELGDRTRFWRHDVASEADWTEVVGAVTARFGRLDILVNNAGIYARRTIDEVAAADFDRMMAVNVKGTFLGIQAALPAMRAAGGGSIVNLSSVAGIVGSGIATDYNASKGAVRLLTKSVAVQCASDGIRCNSVHPAPIETPMGQASMPEGEIREQRLRDIPMGRLGTPEEVANAVYFLASDESSYCTGSELVVDGGLTAR